MVANVMGITVSPGQITFREQLPFGLQPMLNFMSLGGALVHITEVSSSGDFVRSRHEVDFILAQVRVRRRRGGARWFVTLIR